MTKTTIQAGLWFDLEGYGNTITLGDLKEYVATIESLGLSDDTKFEECKIVLSIDKPNIELCRRGDCTSHSFNLSISFHSCEEPPSDNLCYHRGPRIGSSGAPLCHLPIGHTGVHRPHADAGWGEMSWFG